MSQAAEPLVLFEQHGAVGVVTLNRPDKLNAMNAEMVDELRAIVTGAEEQGTVKALVLTGRGRGFSSGMDLNVLAAPADQRRRARANWPRPRPELYTAIMLRNANLPIIGAINGVAAGAGLSLALAPDIRIMSDEARLIPIFNKRGLMPDGGASYFLTRQLGAQKALELLWAAEPIGPEQALALGLVARVVPHAGLMPAALELAEKLSKGPSIAMALTKRAVYQAETGTLDADLELTSFGQQRCIASADGLEGARAFLQKRPPVFRGE